MFTLEAFNDRLLRTKRRALELAVDAFLTNALFALIRSFSFGHLVSVSVEAFWFWSC